MTKPTDLAPEHESLDPNGPGRPAPLVPAELQVLWPKALLDAPVEVAAEAFARSLHGFAKRLDPERAKRFTMSVDTPLYEAIDSIVMAAYGGIHPKHRVTDYHAFFTDRIAEGEHAIDLGCGVGMVALSVIGRCDAAVTGVDWSATNLAIAAKLAAERNAAHKLHLVRGDICETRVPSPSQPHSIRNGFNALILSNILEHVTDRPAHLRTWVEWYNPSRILIRVPAFDRDYRVPLKKELGIDWRCDPTHEIEYTQEIVETEMRQAGLKIRELVIRWCEYWVHAEPA